MIAVYDRRSLRTENFTTDVGAVPKSNENVDLAALHDWTVNESATSDYGFSCQSPNSAREKCSFGHETVFPWDVASILHISRHSGGIGSI